MCYLDLESVDCLVCNAFRSPLLLKSSVSWYCGTNYMLRIEQGNEVQSFDQIASLLVECW